MFRPIALLSLLASLLSASPVLAKNAPSPRQPLPVVCEGCARYHVDPSGSDDASGSQATPWKTLQHAAERVAPGDIVLVHPGRYDGFDLRTSGNAQQPIWFVAEEGVEIVGNNRDTPDGINVEDVSWVGIAGFKVSGAERAGIRAARCHHVFLAGNQTLNNGRWGIFTGFCDDLVIEDNVAAFASEEHGIYVSNSADRPIIRRNVIFGNTQAGIHMNGDKSQGGDGVISNALIDSNLIYNVGKKGAAGINCDGVQSSVLSNNLIHDVHANGIALYRIDGGDASKDNLVVNNTIMVAEDGRYALHIHHGSTGVNVRNNVLLNSHPKNGSIDLSPDSLPGFSSEHNLVMDRFTINDWETVIDLRAWRQATGQDKSSRIVAPHGLFDAGFLPKAGGPALDAGMTKAAPAFDFVGSLRPVGAGADIGALERCAVAGCEGAALETSTGYLRAAPQAKAVAPAPPSSRAGCAGCTLPGGRASAPWWASALALFGLAVLRPRRREA